MKNLIKNKWSVLTRSEPLVRPSGSLFPSQEGRVGVRFSGAELSPSSLVLVPTVELARSAGEGDVDHAATEFMFRANFLVIRYDGVTMVITHHGGQCFKVSFGDMTLAFDPISKKSSLSPVKFGANVAFVSLNHPDFNGIDEVAFGAKQPFVVDGPGEYEIDDVTVRGHGIKTMYDGKERFNTIYQVTLEGMNLLFLGALGSAEIDSKILGELGDVDILFLPIGGADVLDVPAASKLATKLEAHVVIPMHYDAKALGAFLKEEGSENGKPQEKLTIKKKDVITMEGEVVVLKA